VKSYEIFFSFRIRVGRSIQGFGLSPGITKDQRVGVESLMKNAFPKFAGKKYTVIIELNKGLQNKGDRGT
jgi:hypothetical protein